MNNNIEITEAGSLGKIFPREPIASHLCSGSCFCNEEYHYQVAFRLEKMEKLVCHKIPCRFKINSVLGGRVSCEFVQCVPCYMPQNEEDCDDYYIRKGRVDGYYPDLLVPAKEEFKLRGTDWFTLWITVRPDGVSGNFDIVTQIINPDDDSVKAQAVFNLTIYPDRLPDFDLPYSTWIYYECLSDVYRCKMWSKKYNVLLEKCFRNMTDLGINTLILPCFTFDFSLPSEKVKDRQLVDIEIVDGKYRFSFERLGKVIKTAEKCGMKYFEISHFASQWDVLYGVRAVAAKDGGLVDLFKKGVSCTDKEYMDFLGVMLKELTAFFDRNGYKNRVFFHIADEPIEEGIDNYEILYKLFKKNIGGCPVIDAMCDYGYTQRGIMDFPVVATDHTEPFLKAKVPMWVYYCFVQSGKYVSNRAFNMPSQRNRIMGIQLYKNNACGFLHWGYNCWYDLEGNVLNPFLETDAGYCYSGGDSYLVYPAKDGTMYNSLRGKVFLEGINDYRALKLLEKKRGRKFVDDLLDKNGIFGYSQYPRSDKWHTEFRETVNNLIVKEQPPEMTDGKRREKAVLKPDMPL